MVRFFWKKAEDLPHSKPTAAKICKNIDFSHKIDIFDFCTEDLRAKLLPGRQSLEESKKNEEIEFKKQYEIYKENFGCTFVFTLETNRPEKRLMEDFK